ncbi:MAG: hypothetical protein WCH04_18625 [Gammaproteobacteria bacterium]
MRCISLFAIALLGVSGVALADGLNLRAARVDVTEDHSVHRVTLEAKLRFAGAKDLPAVLRQQGAVIDFDLLGGLFGIDEPCWLVSLPPACFVGNRVEHFASCGARLQVVDRTNQVVLFDLTKGVEALEFRLVGAGGHYLAKLDTTFLDIREQSEPCWLPVLLGSEALSLHIGTASGSTVPVQGIADYEPGIPSATEPAP